MTLCRYNSINDTVSFFENFVLMQTLKTTYFHDTYGTKNLSLKYFANIVHLHGSEIDHFLNLLWMGLE